MKRALCCLLSSLLAPSLAGQAVTTPEAHLGRPVGVDFELADWQEVSSYFQLLSQQSPRVTLLPPGRTTEGRQIFAAVLGSEASLGRLDEIRRLNAAIADPRGLDAAEQQRVLDAATTTLFITCNMHSTETASPQFAMELAWRWATSDEAPFPQAREELVVVLVPTLNPDGLDKVVSWYRSTVGTPHEASRLLELYHHYAGHDNNRDWFMVSQAETRFVTEMLYSEWFPHVYWDVHEQGSSRERLFVPPFRDPLDPNLPPSTITALGTLGGRMLHDLTARGLKGVSTGVTYDMWWNGGNRNVPVRHNIAGLLTEAASVNLGSPVWLPLGQLMAPRGLHEYAPSNRFPDPWPGGWWRLRDILDYEMAAAESLLGSLAREPATWRRNVLEQALRSVEEGAAESPRAWIVPGDNRDPLAVRRMLDVLFAGGVEVAVAREEVTADGRRWPAGSLVVSRAQPYGRYVKDLMESQHYPDEPPPYDVTGWTLPYLLGVEVVAAAGDVSGRLEVIDEPTDWEAPDRGSRALDAATSHGWRAAIEALHDGRSLGWTADGAHLLLDGVDDVIDGLPRLGFYAPWSGVHDEGWTRWVLDTFRLPYERLRNEHVRAGRLAERFDVILLPSLSSHSLESGRGPGTVPSAHAGGLGTEGALELETFVRDGGTLVAVQSSTKWVADLFGLPVHEVTAGSDDFSCPGALLRTVPETSRWTAGLPASLPVFFSRSLAWDVDDDADVSVLLRYAPRRLLLSGWIRGEETLAGRAAWVRAEYGRGAIHLFGFRPFYRGWTQGDFPVAFRALVLDRAAGDD